MVRIAWEKVIALSLVMLITMTGCGKAIASTEEKLPQIVVGSDDYKPYYYVGDDGNMAGIDVEMATNAFHRMGYDVVFRKIIWEKKDEYLKNGEIDCLWGSFTMTERENEYTWAGAYFNSRQVVIVRANSGIRTLQDLEGKRFAVQVSSKPDEILLNHEDARIPEVDEIYCFSTLDEVYACLRKGYCDAIAGHESALRLFMDSLPNEFYMLEESLYKSELGVAFEKGTQEELAEELSKTLQQMHQDGTTERILEKYGINTDCAWSDAYAE